MSDSNAGKGSAPAFATMWSRVIAQEVGHTPRLELADRSTCTGRLERVENGRAVFLVEGRLRMICLDHLRAIEEVEDGDGQAEQHV